MAFTITAPKESVILTVVESDGTTSDLDLTPFVGALLTAPAPNYDPMAPGWDLGQIAITDDVAFFDDDTAVDPARGISLLGSGLVHALRLFLLIPARPPVGEIS